MLNLVILGLLLLHQQFGKVWLPQAVTDELRMEQELPGSVAGAPRNKLGLSSSM